MNQVMLNDILPLVRHPSRYLGREFNVRRRDWRRAAVRFALVFPDLYEIGMSHQGLQILYRIINSREELLAERVYAPDLDLEQVLRQKGRSLFSLESRRPLADFDVVGFTLPYELSYTNILTVLDLAGIPFRSSERETGQPLVLGGGAGGFNPEPVAELFDAVLLGDGEEAVLEIADLVRAARRENLDRAGFLERLTGVKGVYVPSLFEPGYDREGRFAGMRGLRPGYDEVERRILPDLQQVEPPLPPLVPLARIVHDRLGLEVARGCTRGCRFCQAGMIYRPVRERGMERVRKQAAAGIAASGFDELALLSLSTGDYSCLPRLLGGLMDRFAPEYVSVSMPSMRVGTLSPEVMAQIKRVRKSGFTVAPEAGTDRLRRVINKGITEQELLDTCRTAFGLGWKLMKFYFMFGLPTETLDDVRAIAGLVRRALATAGRGGCRINVSVATFVPKPHTPFQWERQLSVREGYERLELLKRLLPAKGVKLKWHDPRMSFLEGVFSRGDRRLTPVIIEAWRRGARLDGWSEHFDLSLWEAAAGACGVELSEYLRPRDPSGPLPWQHLKTGVAPDFQLAELERARREEYTPDCRFHGCRKCGVCDLKTVRPLIARRPAEATVNWPSPGGGTGEVDDRAGGGEGDVQKAAGGGERFFYRLWYTRLGEARFLGHLELIQLFFRACRRMALPLRFSEGFNPSPRISFSPALPVGTESEAEFLDLELTRPLADPARVCREFDRQLPAGLTVTSINPVERKKPKQAQRLRSEYRLVLPRPLTAEEKDRLGGFLACESYPLSRFRRGREQRLDVRPLVTDFTVTDQQELRLVLEYEAGKAACKPGELLRRVLEIPERDVLLARIIKQA